MVPVCLGAVGTNPTSVWNDLDFGGFPIETDRLIVCRSIPRLIREFKPNIFTGQRYILLGTKERLRQIFH